MEAANKENKDDEMVSTEEFPWACDCACGIKVAGIYTRQNEPLLGQLVLNTDDLLRPRPVYAYPLKNDVMTNRLKEDERPTVEKFKVASLCRSRF